MTKPFSIETETVRFLDYPNDPVSSSNKICSQTTWAEGSIVTQVCMYKTTLKYLL